MRILFVVNSILLPCLLASNNNNIRVCPEGSTIIGGTMVCAIVENMNKILDVEAIVVTRATRSNLLEKNIYAKAPHNTNFNIANYISREAENFLRNDNYGSPCSAKVSPKFQSTRKLNYFIAASGPSLHNGVYPVHIHLLKLTYKHILNLAMSKNIRSIAIPCISVDNERLPANWDAKKTSVYQESVKAVFEFINENWHHFDEIVFVMDSERRRNFYENVVLYYAQQRASAL